MMRGSVLLVWCVGLFLQVSYAGVVNLGLLFQMPGGEGNNALVHGGHSEPHYADGVKDTEGPGGREAISVDVGSRLVYEGRGNVFIPSGTVSFWWRPDAEPQAAETEVLGLSSMQRFYFCRWIRIHTKSRRLHVTLYHADGAEIFDDTETVRSPDRAKARHIRYGLHDGKTDLIAGQWVHVTVAWDMSKGVALYVNGELAHKVEDSWFYGGNINHISVGSSSASYTQARTATFPQSFAEVRVYDHALDSSSIKALAEGRDPQLEVPNWESMLKERAARYGLSPEAALPEIGIESFDNKGLRIRQVGVVSSRDVMRNTRAAVNGDLGRAWPMYQGYSNSGENLDVRLPDESAFNVIQAMGSGPMRIEVPATKEEEEILLELDSHQTRVISRTFSERKTDNHLRVVRDHGLLFNTEILDVSLDSLPSAESEGWELYGLIKKEAEEAQYQRICEEFATYDRTILQTESVGGKGTLRLAKGEMLHLTGPWLEKKRGLAELLVDLKLTGNRTGTEVSLMLLDPVHDTRRAVMANFRVLPKSTGVRVILDPNDLIYDEGEQPWLMLIANQDLQIELSHSQVGYRWVSKEEAHKEFFHVQMGEVNDFFQELSESRPWAHSPEKLKLLGALLKGIDVLVEMEPDNPMVQGYWHWTHPREKTPDVRLPELPEGVPAWAFYAEQANQLFKKAAYWWIDNRQSPMGEFGAPDGINDDTDLIQDWLAIDLMNGPDEKIRKAVEKVAQISWDLKTVDGVSFKVTDTLHMYEWGINAQTLAFLLNYGDPVYYERLLRFASHYQAWMTELEACGHLHFKTWYFGVGGIRTEGVYGRDILLNGLMLQPAMLLAWYNGDPYCKDLVVRWTDGMREHLLQQSEETNRIPGLSVAVPSGKIIPETTIRISYPDAAWAAWKFSGEPKFLEIIEQIIDWNLSRRPLQNLHTGSSVISAYLNETKNDRWDKRWVKDASESALWESSLHNSNYRQLNLFHAVWLRTGEDSWLDQGSKLTLYHTTWGYPMLTEAEATTDRVWLPQPLVNRMFLGDLSILRNQIYPKHAVSWEHASGRFAPLVRKHSSSALEFEVQNLEEHPLSVDARLWLLDAGLYEVRVEATSRTAGNEADERDVRQMEIQRYSKLPLQVPANGKARVSLTLVEKTEPVEGFADLGISHLDARYDQESGKLTVVIHNIGSRPTGPFQAIARRNGNEIHSADFESLNRPENFRTDKAEFEIPVSGLQDEIVIEVNNLSGEREITLHNNVLRIRPEMLFEPHFTQVAQ